MQRLDSATPLSKSSILFSLRKLLKEEGIEERTGATDSMTSTPTLPWYLNSMSFSYEPEQSTGRLSYQKNTVTTPMRFGEIDHTTNPGLYGLANLSTGEAYVTNNPTVNSTTKSAAFLHEETHLLRARSGQMSEDRHQEEILVRLLTYARTGDTQQLAILPVIQNDSLPRASPIGIGATSSTPLLHRNYTCTSCNYVRR